MVRDYEENEIHKKVALCDKILDVHKCPQTKSEFKLREVKKQLDASVKESIIAQDHPGKSAGG